MRIYLIGFMGSGKTTLGNRIADSLDVPFFDTDRVVEVQSGKSIPEIFELFGEEHFRNLETDVLKQTAFYSKSLNAIGGGLPCFNENMEWMKREGITIYLEWPDEYLIEQLANHPADRPLLNDLKISERPTFIQQLLQSRKPVYEQSAMTLEMTENLEENVRLLEKACKYIW
jgi:shikimate kinase